MANTKNIKKWVTALRSRRFRQGTGRLYNAEDGRRCCLGVACDVYKEETGKGEWKEGYFYPGERKKGSSLVLPPAVRQWLGLSDNDPKLKIIDPSVMVRESATELNDTERRDFEEIADAIERTYLRRAA